MTKSNINIPALCPHPIGNPDSLGSYVSSQPILQLKELEVDRVRYDQWKASLRKPLTKKQKELWKEIISDMINN